MTCFKGSKVSFNLFRMGARRHRVKVKIRTYQLHAE
jgi:hypothetical protein